MNKFILQHAPSVSAKGGHFLLCSGPPHALLLPPTSPPEARGDTAPASLPQSFASAHRGAPGPCVAMSPGDMPGVAVDLNLILFPVH